MIKKVKENQLPFEVVLADSVYGCDTQFRSALDDEQILYVADIHSNTPVYLNRPEVGIPETPEGRRGRPFSRYRVLSPDEPVEPHSLIGQQLLYPVVLRHTEREILLVECAIRRVWTISEDGKVLEEWLLIRKEADGKFKCSLSNAPVTTNLEQLAHWRCERYFVERTFQDAKSELGWDELEARKYRSWMHHSALTALALWFVSETKLIWSIKYPRDPELAMELDISSLPSLSTANIREMLKAVLPLPRLSVVQATHVVVKHLVARSRSTCCRMRQDRRRWQILRT
jgi:SRSO17 transposase